MFQNVKIFQEALFDKIPLHKSIFSPFTPFKTNMNIIHQQQKLTRQCKFQKAQAVVDYEGNYEYIYGHNSQFLDVICCVKNCKYRFILPQQHQGYKQKIRKNQNRQQNNKPQIIIRIVDKMLVMIFHRHVYIHDLIRHNNRLIVQALNQKKEQQQYTIGVGKFEMNEYYIYRVSVMQAVSPLIGIQIYGINMNDNFELVRCMDKLIRIDEQQGSCERLCVSESNHKLSIAVLVNLFETNSYSLKIINFQSKQLSDVSQQFKVNNLENIEKCFNLSTYKVDPVILNVCGIFQNGFQLMSSLRDSWVIKRQSKQQQQLYKQEQIFQNLHIIEGNHFIVVYEQGSTSFLIVLTNKNYNNDEYQTKILSHQAKIAQMARCGMNILLVDDSSQVWSYDFSEEQSTSLPEPILLINLGNKLKSQYPNRPFSIQIYGSQAGHKCAVCVKGVAFYLIYPIIYPNFLQNQRTPHEESLNHNEQQEIQIFLSIQQQNYTHLADGNQQISKIKLLQPYISICSGQQKLNARDHILQEVLPQLNRYLSRSNCQTIRKQELWSIFVQIQSKLMLVMSCVLETIYDCEANQFYWCMAGLMEGEMFRKDMKYIAHVLIKQEMQNKANQPFIETVLNEYKFMNYLAAKCANTDYVLSCTTPFQKCILLSGCNCVYKRVLRYFIHCHNAFHSLQLNDELFYQPFIKYQHIIGILSQSSEWKQQLNQLINQRQIQVQHKIQKHRNKLIKRLDKKWQGEFKTQQKFSPITDEQFYQRSTSKKQRQYFQISYKIQQQQQNQLYQNLPAQFAQRILGLQNKIVKLNDSFQQQQAMRKYLSQIQCICNKYKLLSNQNVNLSIQLNEKQKQCKIAMCILVASKLYQKYGKEKQNEQNQIQQSKISQYSFRQLSSANMSRSFYNLERQIKECASLYRKVWLLIVKLLIQAIKLNYVMGVHVNKQSKSHLQNMIHIITQSIINPKYFPALVPFFTTESDSKILTFNQLDCLMQSVIKAQIYRFQTSPQTKQPRQYKYRYHPRIWDNGISKIIQISQKLKKQSQTLP